MRTYPNVHPLRSGSPQAATLNGVARALAEIYDTPTDDPVSGRIAELLAELEEATDKAKTKD